jgi:phosphoserine phosphatase RsbU/P
VRQPHVIVASNAPDDARTSWWCAEIARAWPRQDQAPTLDARTLPELARALDKAPRRAPEQAVLLLCPDRREAGPALMQALDRIIGLRAAAVVLAPHEAGLAHELEPHGVPVEALDVDPARIAAALCTLLVRQAAVATLGAELRVARAAQSGLSGEIGRLHDELQLAGAVQRRFLPREMPDAPGYAFGVLFQPCGYVSGDIYDVVAIDTDRTAFMLADAVGHGVPAALLTLVLGRALRQHHEPGDEHPLASPARTLDRLNTELCVENETGDRFATAVCGVLDARHGRITLAGAGHPCPVAVSAEGRAREIDIGNGPLLGVFPEAPFDERTIALEPGETLVLFSDGFETAFADPAHPDDVRANRAYIEHFARAAAAALGEEGGAPEAAALLAQDLRTQAGSLNQRDDLTALLLSRAPAHLALAGPRTTHRRSAA